LSSAKQRNLLIGQSGGATAVINASLVGAFEAAHTDARVGEIYGMHYGIEGLLKEDLIDLRRQPASLWPRLLRTPSAALGSCRYQLQDGDVERILTLLRRYHVGYVLYTGGNDSADTSHRLAEAARAQGHDLAIISLPKTIDNDLPATDHCPGYGSAGRFYAQATIDSTLNMRALPATAPIKVIEIPGRTAGWLVSASALGKRDEADPPHLILVPEHPFREEQFLERVEAVYRRGGTVVIATSEAIHDEQGRFLGTAEPDQTDAFHHPQISGAGQAPVKSIEHHLGLQGRTENYGDLQWCCISRTDQDEAYRVGQAGVRAGLQGVSDIMITLVRQGTTPYRCTTGQEELVKIANQQRALPDEYFDAETMMVTPAFYEYALPLLGDPLPDYARIEEIRVRPQETSQ